MQDVEARLIGLALLEPAYAIPRALAVGLEPEDYGTTTHTKLWSRIVEMWQNDTAIDPVTVKANLSSLSDYIDSLADLEGRVDAETYAKLIVEQSLRRAEQGLGSRILQQSKQEDVDKVLYSTQSELDRLSARFTRMNSPLIKNPADALGDKGWSTDTGLPFIDRLLRLTSGGIHFLAGDPGSGKTTQVIHMLAHNAQHGVNAVGLLAESSQLEVSLGMLTQKKAISSYWASQIRFNPEFRTKERVEKIRNLWDEHFGDLPLQVHSVNSGPPEIISIMNAITEPSLICIDHAYAVVSQGRVSEKIREHQSFNHLFSAVQKAAERNDHIVVMVNQYTKAGRQEETRDADAEYGGSGVRNIATSMIHLMQPEAAIVTAAGYRQMEGTIPKCRAMLVADKHGNPIDPVQITVENGMPFRYFVNTRYRLVVDKLPTAK